jgi:hypothetical protein
MIVAKACRMAWRGAVGYACLMNRLRRSASFIGLATALLLTLYAAIGGLALARSLPEAVAKAAAFAAICLPSENAPASHHEDAAGHCIACLNSVQAAFKPPHNAPAPHQFVQFARAESTISFEAGLAVSPSNALVRPASARGPPIS